MKFCRFYVWQLKKNIIKFQQILLENQKNGKDNDYNFDIKKNYNNISKKACAIITRLYLDYIATKEENEKIRNILYENTIKKEEINKQKYNPNDIFKNKESITQKNNIEKNVTLVEYKESIFTKIINKIKKIFFNK